MDLFGLSWEQIRSGALRVTNSLIINKIADILETAGFYLTLSTDGVPVVADEAVPVGSDPLEEPNPYFIWWSAVRGEQGKQGGEQSQDGMEAIFGQLFISALLGIILMLSLYAFFIISKKLVGHLTAIYNIIYNGYIYMREIKERNRRLESRNFDEEVRRKMVAKAEEDMKREVKEENNRSSRTNTPINDDNKDCFYHNLRDKVQYLNDQVVSDPVTVTGYVEQMPEVEVEAPPNRRRFTPYNPFSPNTTSPEVNPWIGGYPPRAESSQPYSHTQVSGARRPMPVRPPETYHSVPPPIPPRTTAPNYGQTAAQTNYIPPNNEQILPEDAQLRQELQEMRARLRDEVLNRQRLEGELRQNNQMRGNQSMNDMWNSSATQHSDPVMQNIDPISNNQRPQNPTNPSIPAHPNASAAQVVNPSATINIPREAFELLNNLSRATANNASQPKRVTEKIEIPKFNGDINEAYEWHREFMRITESKRWTNEDRMKNIPNYLTDSAKVWFNGTYHEGMTWEQFLPLFFELYIPEDTIYRFQQEYNNAKQRPSETAVQYLYRVVELGKRFNDDINMGQIKMILKKGLRLDLAKYAISARNFTLNEMVEMLKGYDSVDMENNRRREYNNRNPFNNNQRTTNYMPNQQLITNTIPQITTQMPTQTSYSRPNQTTLQTPIQPSTQTQPLNTVQQQLVNNNLAASNVPQQSRNRSMGFQIICANCRAIGHRLSECPQPHNKQDIDKFFEEMRLRRLGQNVNQTAPKTSFNNVTNNTAGLNQNQVVHSEGGDEAPQTIPTVVGNKVCLTSQSVENETQIEPNLIQRNLNNNTESEAIVEDVSDEDSPQITNPTDGAVVIQFIESIDPKPVIKECEGRETPEVKSSAVTGVSKGSIEKENKQTITPSNTSLSVIYNGWTHGPDKPAIYDSCPTEPNNKLIPSPTAPVSIEQHIIPAIFDTGSNITAVTHKFTDKSQNKVVPWDKGKCFNFDGSVHHPMGVMKDVNISFNNKRVRLDVALVKDLKPEAILGTDFLSLANVDILPVIRHITTRDDPNYQHLLAYNNKMYDKMLGHKKTIEPEFLGWNDPNIDLNDKVVPALDDDKQIIDWKRKRRRLHFNIKNTRKPIKTKRWRLKLKRSTRPTGSLSIEADKTDINESVDNFFEGFNIGIDSEISQSFTQPIPSVIEVSVIQSHVPTLIRMEVKTFEDQNMTYKVVQNPKYPFLIPEKTYYCSSFKKLEVIIKNTTDRPLILESDSHPIKLELMADIPPKIMITTKTENETEDEAEISTNQSNIAFKCNCKHCRNPSKTIPVLTKMFCSEPSVEPPIMPIIEDIDGYEVIEKQKIVDVNNTESYLSRFNIGEHPNEAVEHELKLFSAEYWYPLDRRKVPPDRLESDVKLESFGTKTMDNSLDSDKDPLD